MTEEEERDYLIQKQKTHYLFNDINSNVRIWVSKTKKINYKELHKTMAMINTRIAERELESV